MFTERLQQGDNQLLGKDKSQPAGLVFWGGLVYGAHSYGHHPPTLCATAPPMLCSWTDREEVGMQKGGENSWNGSIQCTAAVWNPPQLAPVSPTSGFSFLLLHLILTQNMLNQWAGRPGRDWTDKFSHALYWRKDPASQHGDSVFLSC